MQNAMLNAFPPARDRTAVPVAEQKIGPCDRKGPLPLSLSQQRLWFLSQFDQATSAAYQMHFGIRIAGSLDVPALKASLDRIVARHEMLRTCFQQTGNGPVQVVGPATSGFPLVQHDLRGLGPAEQEQAVAASRASETRQPFDLASGPLIRGRLLQLSDASHLLLISQHHVISDGWSVGNLMREVSALYPACSAGSPDPLPPLPLQYADYAVWQREWLQGSRLREQTDFWRRHLDGAPPLLALPSDRPRPSTQSYRAGSVHVKIPPPLAAGLHKLAGRHDMSLFMTLLSAWSLLLARMSGQYDVVVGTAVSNRQPGTESLLGFFVNTLPLRVRLEGDPTVAELFARVKAGAMHAYMHQDLPFEKIVEAIQPERDLSHHPLFQTMFTLDNTPNDGDIRLPGISLGYDTMPAETTPMDLFLVLAPTGNTLTGELTYSKDLFEHATVTRLVAHFMTLLGSMIADDGQRIGQVPLMSPAQRRQLRVDFNATAAAYPHDSLVHELFEHRAAVQPEAVAVVFADQQLSYDQLNRRANQLAHHLRSLGIRNEDRIAVRIAPGPALVIALLGILKAGAAHVVLDPELAMQDQALRLADCTPAAFVTDTGTAQFRPDRVPVVCLAADADRIASQCSDNPERRGASWDLLACVAYLSGSSGAPKGVMIEHRSLVNVLSAIAGAPGMTRTDTLLAMATARSGFAGLEHLAPLACGARLVVADPEAAADPAMLDALIERHAVTHLLATAATWRKLTTRGWKGAGGLTAWCGAGALTCDLAAALLQRVDSLWNLYGASETTGWSTCRRVVQAGPVPGAVESIGRPLANTRIYILDDKMQPVPPGISGDLYIGGDGVARGYLDHPELSAQSFIADPYGDREGARMFKTGDIASWRPDGDIDYLGRSDCRVVLRGVPIALGAIEAQLRQCEGVEDAAVVLDARGERLVAYMLVRPGAAPGSAALRTRLAGALPGYMLPSDFVALDDFPRTLDGEPDRSALRARAAAATAGYEPPDSPTEVLLAHIWTSLLGARRIGRQDHFFKLGGDAQLAARLGERLRAEGLQLAVQDMLAFPTLAAMSTRVAKHPVDHASVPASRIPTGVGRTAAVEEFEI